MEEYSLFLFLLALRAGQNAAQPVKIINDTTHQNVWKDTFIILLH